MADYLARTTRVRTSRPHRSGRAAERRRLPGNGGATRSPSTGRSRSRWARSTTPSLSPPWRLSGYRRAAPRRRLRLRLGRPLHDLRHTFAVLQLSAGTHFMQVSKWLGHSTFTLTLDTYGDYIPEQDGGAVNTLPEPPAPMEPVEKAGNVLRLFG